MNEQVALLCSFIIFSLNNIFVLSLRQLTSEKERSVARRVYLFLGASRDMSAALAYAVNGNATWIGLLAAIRKGATVIIRFFQ